MPHLLEGVRAPNGLSQARAKARLRYETVVNVLNRQAFDNNTYVCRE